jgi:hypothetical protein
MMIVGSDVIMTEVSSHSGEQMSLEWLTHQNNCWNSTGFIIPWFTACFVFVRGFAELDRAAG